MRKICDFQIKYNDGKSLNIQLNKDSEKINDLIMSQGPEYRCYYFECTFIMNQIDKNDK